MIRRAGPACAKGRIIRVSVARRNDRCVVARAPATHRGEGRGVMPSGCGSAASRRDATAPRRRARAPAPTGGRADSRAPRRRPARPARCRRTAMLRAPPLVPEPAQGHASRSRLVVVTRPGEQIDQCGRVEPMARIEIRFRAGAGEAVPRTHELAVVASEDAVADQRAQGRRDSAVQLDGEIRDAQARVELVGGDDRPGRACVDAGAAGSAVVRRRRVHLQRQVGVELSEKEPGAGPLVDEVRVLPILRAPACAPTAFP